MAYTKEGFLKLVDELHHIVSRCERDRTLGVGPEKMREIRFRLAKIQNTATKLAEEGVYVNLKAIENLETRIDALKREGDISLSDVMMMLIIFFIWAVMIFTLIMKMLGD